MNFLRLLSIYEAPAAAGLAAEVTSLREVSRPNDLLVPVDDLLFRSAPLVLLASTATPADSSIF